MILRQFANSLSRRSGLVFALALLLLSGCAAFKDDIDPNATVEELYAEGKKQLDKKNWNTAIEHFRALEAKFPYGTYAEQAQLNTAYAYYRNSESGLAIAAAERFIKLHPTHESVDYAYYLKGLASYEENNSTFGRLTGQDDLSDRDANLTRNAYDAFQDVSNLFPDSVYATDARARSRYLFNALAKHEIAVANYYLSRKAYVAVVNRAKGVIEEYSTTPSVEEALALLVFSYHEMGLTDLSDDARRVLALNFPQSAYLEPGGRSNFRSRWYSAGSSTEDDEDGFFSGLYRKLTDPAS